MGDNKIPIEERYRYIGFDVFPKKAKPLFESPEEEKKFLEKVRGRTSKFFFLEREHSLIEVPTLTKAERVVILLCSLFILTGFFIFPVGSVYVKGIGNLSVSGLSLLLNLSSLSPILALGGTQILIITALGLAFLILGVLTGGLQLVAVLTSWKTNRGQTVSRFNRLGLFPVLFWVAALIVGMFSIPTPAWDLLGAEQLGKSFHTFRLISMTGVGLWLVFAGLIINSSIVGE